MLGIDDVPGEELNASAEELVTDAEGFLNRFGACARIFGIRVTFVNDVLIRDNDEGICSGSEFFHAVFGLRRAPRALNIEGQGDYRNGQHAESSCE